MQMTPQLLATLPMTSSFSSTQSSLFIIPLLVVKLMSKNPPFIPYHLLLFHPFPSLNILGFNLPINSLNTNSIWSNLQHKLINHSNLLSSRNLSLKGKVLISKFLLLSKLWYYTPICPPPPNFIKSIQNIINKFIWGTSHIHPSFSTSSF